MRNIFNKLTKKLLKNQLISGSFVLFLGAIISNFGSYLFHLLMGRMLGPIDYGELTSLISLVYILSIVSTTLTTTAVKFTTKYRVKKDYQSIFSLFWESTKLFLKIGLGLAIIFLLFQKKISNFLHLKNSLFVVLVGIWLGISFVGFVNDAVLRGFLNFKFLALNTIFATFLRVGGAVALVWLGLGVLGALGASFLASLLPYLLSFYPLRFLWDYQIDRNKVPWKELLIYSWPVLLANLGLTSLYTTDIVLVRHFFPAYEAGLYASLAVLGKIVFFASSMVPTVMFPLVSERYEDGKNYQKLFSQSFLMVLLISLGITMVYFLFPKLMILLLYGNSYLGGAPYLGLFGFFICLYSLCNLLINFFLSTKKLNLAILPFVAAIIQILFIYLFHSFLIQIIYVSLLVTALLLILLLLYYFQGEKKF